MEQIEGLLAQAEQDAVQSSDEAMRLIVEFGNDPLLLEFVASSNEVRRVVNLLFARLQRIKQQTPSPSRNLEIQVLSIDATSVKDRASRLKETVQEISRND